MTCSHWNFTVEETNIVGWVTCNTCGEQVRMVSAYNALAERMKDQMKIVTRTLRAIGWYPHDSASLVPLDPPDNLGMLALATIETPDDLASAIDACVRAYVENLDTADTDTYMGVMEALDSIKRRVLKTLLTYEGDPQ